LLADLHCDGAAEHLSVSGLDEAAIAAMVEAAVGHAGDDGPSELVPVLRAQTAGNPFFLRELLAHLVESGAPDAGGQLAAPESVRQVIAQRVARLSAPARRTLCVAAAAGVTFSFRLLERVLGERSGVLDALDEAVAAGLLAEALYGEYVFVHTVVRQTIYGGLGSARRMRFHRQLGEALEALEDVDAHVETRAHHFAQAAVDGIAIKGADYALVAGRRATSCLGFEEAADHYERGHRRRRAAPRGAYYLRRQEGGGSQDGDLGSLGAGSTGHDTR
jgi:predicted ATPase